MTGSTGLVGGIKARALTKTRGRVAVLSRHTERVEALTVSLVESVHETLALSVDVLEPESFVTNRDVLTSRWGRLDILANAPGASLLAPITSDEHTFFALNLAILRRASDLNLMGPFAVTGFHRANGRGGKGPIVNIFSIVAQKPLPSLT